MVRQWIHLTHTDIKELAVKDPWVIIPLGSTEQHGSHMPVGTDALIAEASVAEAGKYLDDDPVFLSLPVLNYTKSIEHMAFSGTITLSARTLLDVVDDIVFSLVQHGMRRIIFVNGHGGNIGLVSGYLQDLRQKYQIEAFFIHVGRLIESACEGYRYDMHAGDVETSLLLYWYPELVKEHFRSLRSTASKGLEFLKKLDGSVDWGWSVEDISPAGYIGSPQDATFENGKRLAQVLGETLSQAMVEVTRR